MLAGPFEAFIPRRDRSIHIALASQTVNTAPVINRNAAILSHNRTGWAAFDESVGRLGRIY
jgi:hypothetical protein